MATGDLKKLGGFYLNGAVQALPTRPWYGTPKGASASGNVPSFSAGKTIEIRDTPSADGNKIQWIEVNYGGKKYLVADRTLLVNVSWNDLNSQDLITGKQITVDGQKYLLRVLKGGANYRSGTDAYSGGTSPNEWDRWITNEAGLTGLPTPTTTDLDKSQTDADLTGVHNQKWNWYYMHSWCQETYTGNSESSVFRGYDSARYWNKNSATSRSTHIGWRPVLEVLNASPTITLDTTTEPSGTVTNKPSFNYTVTDADVGEKLTVTEKIDGMTIRTESNVTSGTTLTFTPTDLLWLRTRINTPVTIEISVSDGKGGTATKTFTITRTTPNINLQLKTPFTTDVKANSILLNVEKSAPAGSTFKVEVCNNAFDASPTWEDATNLLNMGLPYPFQNKTKTATNWGVSFRITLTRGSAVGQVSIDGIGGAYD